VPGYVTHLQRRRDLTEGTAAFYFARPAGFAFEAGQSVNLTLPDPPEKDSKGSTRTFSLVSAPGEATLEIATRVRTSAFKRLLASLPQGSPVHLRGPGGRFGMPAGDGPVVMLATGIGITPFVSMLRDAAAKGSRRPITLFFANRRPGDAPYLDELQALRRRLPSFTLVTTMTGADPGARNGERGPVDAAMIARHVPDITAPAFLIAGQPSTVSGLRAALTEAGANARAIHVEEFYGY